VNGIQYALRRVYSGENRMLADLSNLAERHRAEHEVHHVARDLARWSKGHVQLLTEQGRRMDLEPELPQRPGQLEAGADTDQPAAVALLEDLAQVYLRAAENSLAWEMLAQIAQAKRESALVDLAAQCHPQNLRQLRWANTMIKTLAPQALSGLE